MSYRMAIYSNRWRLNLVLCLLTLAGCSDGLPTHKVTGTVSYTDGKPLPGGTIEFRSLGHDGLNAKGVIAPNGSFEMTTFESGDGAVAGEHQVMIAPLPRPDADGGPRLQNTIDPRFLSFRKSGITVTVSGTEPNDFALQVHAAQPQTRTSR